MILVTASLLALSLTFSAVYGILGSGSTFTSAATQSSALPINVCSLLMMVGFFVLCIRAIISLALFCHSYSPRLSVSSGNRFRWLFGTAFLLPVFASAAFVLYPSANYAFHTFACHVSAVVSELWSFIQQGFIGLPTTRCFFDKLGNFTQLLNSAKEVLHQCCANVSALFESLDIIARNYYPLTGDFNSAFKFARLSNLMSPAVDFASDFDFISSTLTLSWSEALTFVVIMCLTATACKLYVSTRELKVALQMRDEAMSVEAEVFKKESAFYKTRVTTLHNTNEGLITALESALPRITTAELLCAEARAYVNKLEVALEDLEDAHAVDIALFETSLIASEEKATKAVAHARSLMKTSKAQRSTISSLRASSERLIRRCSTLEDAISTLSTRNDQLETMVHHLRIGIAKLASVSQAPLVDASVSLYEDAEESTKAVSAPYVDSEVGLDCASYQDSLSDFVDEEECAGSSDAVLSFAGTETPVEYPLPYYVEDSAQQVDAEDESLCSEIQDVRLPNSFLIETVEDVEAPCDNTREPAPSTSSDLSLYNTSEYLCEDGGSHDVTSTIYVAAEEVSLPYLTFVASNPPSADLLEAAETFLRSVFAKLAPSESCPLLTSAHGDVVDVANLGPESPFPIDSSRTEDNTHHLSTSIFAPLGPDTLHAAPHKATLLSEMIFCDVTSGSPSSPSTDAPSEVGPLTPIQYTPSSSLFSQGYALSPFRSVRAGNSVALQTPVCAFKGKVKASITASTRKFLANKENSMPQA